MTNLEKLSNIDIYELLITINENMLLLTYHDNCVLDTLEERHIKCIYGDCKECIREYLDKDGENNDI